ncbi:MAG: hypothetical protein ACRES9_08955 [Gammaproteobacteria bacterium]
MVRKGLLCSAVILIACTTGFSTGAATLNRQRIVSNLGVKANGCHEQALKVQFDIPNADRLDRSYRGVLPGIEIVKTTANGKNGPRYVRFVNSGKSLAFTLWAQGAGHWVPPVCIFGKCIGGGWCAGAKGAWITVDIYAHYK